MQECFRIKNSPRSGKATKRHVKHVRVGKFNSIINKVLKSVFRTDKNVRNINIRHGCSVYSHGIFLPLNVGRRKKKVAIINMDADGYAWEKSDLIELISIFEGCCTKGCLR